ncbi:MAG: hypothetical protein LBP63_07465 [Prevotellaceae bacterium]|jgi:hypothetical protein|nr:hypothetical protein [Prevotellaceae bacterium]
MNTKHIIINGDSRRMNEIKKNINVHLLKTRLVDVKVNFQEYDRKISE